jgi:lactate permease
MQGLIGLLPFLALFGMLAFTRIPAYLATLTTMLGTCVLASAIWHAPTSALTHAADEGTVTAFLPILWVIFAAIFVYFVSTETGAMDVIRNMLCRACPDIRIQAVLIAFCFGGFLEAVAGFGTAVAIPTAMLITLGCNPVAAATVALVANSVPVAFGALGIPVITLAKVTDLDVSTLTRHIALQLALFAVVVPVGLAKLADRSRPLDGWVVRDALLIGVVFSATQVAVAFVAGPELVAVVASLFSLVLFLVIQQWRSPEAKGLFTLALLRATLPFLILLVLVLTTRLISIPVLQKAPFTFTTNAFSTTTPPHPLKLDIATTPGTLLLLAGVIGGLIQGLRPARLGALLWKTAKTVKWTSVTIVSILILAKVMTVSGMIASVAVQIAHVSGSMFPIIAPMLGALGTFVTGSDTSSNILLGELQKQTAISTGFDPAWVTAANTTGATAGKMISPQSIAIACSTVGIESRQREIFRKTIVYCALYVVAVGLLVWLGALTRIPQAWTPHSLPMH